MALFSPFLLFFLSFLFRLVFLGLWLVGVDFGLLIGSADMIRFTAVEIMYIEYLFCDILNNKASIQSHAKKREVEKEVKIEEE
ncbi:hypothetical protein L873DRAFT_1104781 [Choiromyces venosus 120613-1]|uniref:Uncharacterized protein n=1 Tax=Choiromyces venosus 120613-1 TaxID=1336337 RepID=A0A3N4JHF4_9PEZI|nr:hypothetical protein L873DRAFT_1104781 [Choiromyces venosus 120613-1]